MLFFCRLGEVFFVILRGSLRLSPCERSSGGKFKLIWDLRVGDSSMRGPYRVCSTPTKTAGCDGPWELSKTLSSNLFWAPELFGSLNVPRSRSEGGRIHLQHLAVAQSIGASACGRNGSLSLIT